MKETYKYTFLTMFLALAFIFGSMAAMNFVLYIREDRLLSESGMAVVESPVRPWQGWGDEPDEKEDGKRYSLTAVQVRDAVERWDKRLGETLHDPVEGQVSMEEAVQEAEEWLITMGIGEARGADDGLKFVKAALGVGVQKGSSRVPLEPYHSFWTVHFSGACTDAVLYLNAVTGRVWSAEVTFYDDLPKELPSETLECFVERAGLQVTDDAAELNEEKTQAVLAVEDGMLYAGLEYQSVVLGDNAVVEYTSRELFHDRYVVITYEILTEQNILHQ